MSAVPWMLFLFVAACFGAAFTGAYFRPGTWYAALDKPPWNPPDWAFPVVWTILYGMIAAAGWFVYAAAPPGEALVPVGAWALQIVLNAAWSPAFFGLRRPELGMIVVVALWLSVLACILIFWPISKLASGLMVYLAWVSLNWSVWRRNPNAHEIAA